MKLSFKLFGSVALASVLFLSAISCEEKSAYGSRTNEDDIVDTEPSLVSFKTIQEVKFNLYYDVPVGFVTAFDVYEQNPLEYKDGSFVLNKNLKTLTSGISISGKL